MRALSLPGCGCRGAFQIAVLRRLARRGEHFDLVAGASSGSISGSAWVSGRAEVGPDLFRSMATTPVVSSRWLRSERSPFGMSAIVRDALERLLPEAEIAHSPIELLVATTRARALAHAAWSRLRHGPPHERAPTRAHASSSSRLHREPHDATRPYRGSTLRDALVVHSNRTRSDMHDVIIASCTIPGVYARLPVLDGEIHVDGGAADNTLLEALLARGADDLTIITPYVGGVVAQTLFDAERAPKVPRDVRLRIISPLRTLSLGRFDFDPRRLDEALSMPHVEEIVSADGFAIETRIEAA
jgi:predicted acylesterase/phospholipase RssA